MQGELNLVWKHLLPAMKKDRLPANSNTYAALKNKLASLSLPLPAQGATSSKASTINRNTFSIEENPLHIKSVSFISSKNKLELVLKDDTASYTIAFSANSWHQGTTTKVGPYLLARAKARLTGLPPFKVAGHYSWKDQNTVTLTLRYIESPHTEKLICRINDNKLIIDVENSVNKMKVQLKGELTD